MGRIGVGVISQMIVTESRIMSEVKRKQCKITSQKEREGSRVILQEREQIVGLYITSEEW